MYLLSFTSYPPSYALAKNYKAKEQSSLLKSVNLQYNTLVCRFAGTKDSSTKRLMFKELFFFIIFHRLGTLKTLYFYYKKIN
jgi:hypothetical protein